MQSWAAEFQALKTFEMSNHLSEGFNLFRNTHKWFTFCKCDAELKRPCGTKSLLSGRPFSLKVKWLTLLSPGWPVSMTKCRVTLGRVRIIEEATLKSVGQTILIMKVQKQDWQRSEINLELETWTGTPAWDHMPLKLSSYSGAFKWPCPTLRCLSVGFLKNWRLTLSSVRMDIFFEQLPLSFSKN